MPTASFYPWPLPLLLILYLCQILIVCMQSPFVDFSQQSPFPPVDFSPFHLSLLSYSFQLSLSISLLFSPFHLSLLSYSFRLSPSISLLFFCHLHLLHH